MSPAPTSPLPSPTPKAGHGRRAFQSRPTIAAPSLRRLIDVASFGIRPEPAVLRRPVLKGVYPGIAPADRVLIWNGGILHWYDPTTLLHAMASLRDARPEIKLFFLGTKYPVA